MNMLNDSSKKKAVVKQNARPDFLDGSVVIQDTFPPLFIISDDRYSLFYGFSNDPEISLAVSDIHQGPFYPSYITQIYHS
jgi:hypothetical protein